MSQNSNLNTLISQFGFTLYTGSVRFELPSNNNYVAIAFFHGPNFTGGGLKLAINRVGVITIDVMDA